MICIYLFMQSIIYMCNYISFKQKLRNVTPVTTSFLKTPKKLRSGDLEAPMPAQPAHLEVRRDEMDWVFGGFGGQHLGVSKNRDTPKWMV